MNGRINRNTFFSIRPYIIIHVSNISHSINFTKLVSSTGDILYWKAFPQCGSLVLVWPLPSMYSYKVSEDFFFHSNNYHTSCTCMGFPSMISYMICKTITMRDSFATIDTLIQSLTGCPQSVCLCLCKYIYIFINLH